MNPKTKFVPVHLFDPQACGTTEITGTTIVRPWEKGRTLSCFFQAADLAAADAFTIKFQARRVGTSTWDDIQKYDGSADLAVPATVAAFGGAIEQGTILASLDLQRLSRRSSGANLVDTYEYDAVRVHAVNADNSTPPVLAGIGIIHDLYTEPATDLSGNDVVDHTYFLSNGLDT